MIYYPKKIQAVIKYKNNTPSLRANYIMILKQL